MKQIINWEGNGVDVFNGYFKDIHYEVVGWDADVWRIVASDKLTGLSLWNADCGSKSEAISLCEHDAMEYFFNLNAN